MDEVRKNDSGESVSFSIMLGHTLAISEISMFPKEFANEFINDSDLNDKQKQLVHNVIESVSKVYFYSRLKVPHGHEENGYGTKLLKETLKFIKEENALLINTANAYGKKDQKDLIKYYQKHGMILVHQSGGLVYSPLLQLEEINNLEFKLKKLKKT